MAESGYAATAEAEAHCVPFYTAKLNQIEMRRHKTKVIIQRI